MRKSPDGTKLTPTEKEWSRFWKKVVGHENPAACWRWNGAAGRYGFFGFRGRNIAAHRFAYRAWPTKDAIPEDRPQLDHRCRNGLCVNPDHLDPVTNRENSLRGIGFSAVNARKTHCPKGHRYTPENTGLQKHGGVTRRHCRTCKRAAAALRHRRNRPQFACLECGAVTTTKVCPACKATRVQLARAERLAARQIESRRRRLFCGRHRIQRSTDSKGHVFCPECRREQTRRKLDPNRYNDRRALGLCLTCGRRRDSERSRCHRCHQRHIAGSRASRARARKQNGPELPRSGS